MTLDLYTVMIYIQTFNDFILPKFENINTMSKSFQLLVYHRYSSIKQFVVQTEIIMVVHF